MSDSDADLIEMKVQAIVKDENDQYVVVLRRGTGEADDWAGKALPIVVGPAEARAIHTELLGVAPPRPMTHDLMKTVLTELNAELTRIVVSDLQEDVFYAIVDLERSGQRFEIDARPSDAIALGLRAGAPIFVARHVHDQAALVIEEEQSEEEGRFRDLMGGLAVEDEGAKD